MAWFYRGLRSKTKDQLALIDEQPDMLNKLIKMVSRIETCQNKR
jgi:hypothetical protein